MFLYAIISNGSRINEKPYLSMSLNVSLFKKQVPIGTTMRPGSGLLVAEEGEEEEEE